jgi:sugar lactone lactonase YvrE
MNVERVGDIACGVGESPVWDAGSRAWHWVDIPAQRIWRLDATGVLRHWDTAEMPACIALRAGAHGGGFIAGMESGIFALQLGEDGAVAAERLGTPPELGPGMRFNDGRCDRQGRFWSGTLWMDAAAANPAGCLYRYDANGLSSPIVTGLVTQNGLAWSPDGRIMYLSDSHPTRQRIWAFDYDVDVGVPYGRRLFVDMHDFPGRPDGATVDADGCYWIAGNDGGCLLRFTPSGKLDRQLPLPVSKPSMACFGGPDLDTFLVTSIAPGYTAHDACAGAVLLVKPGVCGLPETPFGG